MPLGQDDSILGSPLVSIVASSPSKKQTNEKSQGFDGESKAFHEGIRTQRLSPACQIEFEQSNARFRLVDGGEEPQKWDYCKENDPRLTKDVLKPSKYDCRDCSKDVTEMSGNNMSKINRATTVDSDSTPEEQLISTMATGNYEKVGQMKEISTESAHIHLKRAFGSPHSGPQACSDFESTLVRSYGNPISPGPGWKPRVESVLGVIRIRWLSPKRKIKFLYFKVAFEFAQTCKNYNGDEQKGWEEFAKMKVALGLNLTKFVERPSQYSDIASTKAIKSCKIVEKTPHKVSIQPQKRAMLEKHPSPRYGTSSELKSLLEKNGWTSCVDSYSKGENRIRWYSPKLKIKFRSWKVAHEFQEICLKFNGDENQGWIEFANAKRALGLNPSQLTIRSPNHTSVQAVSVTRPEISTVAFESEQNKANDDECFICCTGGGKRKYYFT